jgi:hypothetical protein
MKESPIIESPKILICVYESFVFNILLKFTLIILCRTAIIFKKGHFPPYLKIASFDATKEVSKY